MDNQRLILFFILAFILLFIWEAWQREHAPPAPVPAPAAQPTTPDASVPAAPDLPARAGSAPAVEIAASAERIEVITDLVRAEIDTHGGVLRRLWLLKHGASAERPDEPFELLRDNKDDTFLSRSGLIGHGREYPTHNTRYQTTALQQRLAPDQDELRVPLTWRAPDGVRYTKTYVFQRDSYVVGVEFKVTNSSARDWAGFMYGELVHSYVEPPGIFAVPTYTGAAIYTPEDKYQKIGFPDMASKPFKRETTDGWVAILQHYFVGAWLRAPEERSELYTRELIPRQLYAVGFRDLTSTEVARGQSGQLMSRVYLGPKEHERLEQAAENLELTVDYGLLTVIAAPLFWTLKAIHDWVGNWGWAIVLLTVLIKLVFYPLSAASYKSMAHMKKVQPKLQAIKERCGDDRQRLQQEMMELYKTEKINPLGGCLPIVVQIPVFIALYWVLLESVEMRQAPFVLWIRDLSSPDPYYVLPLLMGVTMYIQQWLNPAPVDPVQKKVFMLLPVVFTGLFVIFPAGLVLYWVVNNVLSIAQQWRITRVIEAGGK